MSYKILLKKCQSQEVRQGANENRKYVVEGLPECLRKTDLYKVYVKMELTEGETLTAERKYHFFVFFE